MSSSPLPRIAVLIAAHNRKALTIRALRALRENRTVFDLEIVIFDDGSTDGTSEAIKAEWPNATILQGNGNAYWNGAMHEAWKHALTLKVDGYLWLNDDVLLDRDALEKLANEWHHQGGALQPFVIVGATRNSAGELSYGGQRRIHSPFSLGFEKLPISRSRQFAETFNGNIVLIPESTVELIGINDSRFKHSLGDLDYGLRASSANIKIIVLAETIGHCDNNTPVDLKSMSFIDRYRYITSFKCIPIKSWFRFTKKYSGIYFILHFLGPYRKIITS